MDPFCRGIAGELWEVRRSGGELCAEWRLPRFLDLPSGWSDHFESPRFDFYDARWHLKVWPNYCSSGEVYLYLQRDDDGGPSARTVTVSVGVGVGVGGVERRTEEEEREFRKYGFWTLGGLCRRSELSEQKERLMPRDALAIECVMKVPGTVARGASSCPDVPTRIDTQTIQRNTRICKCQSLDKQGIERKVLDDMGKLLEGGNRSDVTVQIQDAEFKVHSSILCARSLVLSAMLEHNTSSNRITINDCQPDVFEEYLSYLYTGSVQSLSQQTVFGLYRVADQYQAENLKLLCLEHIRETLCVQTFCDAVKLALTHGESDLLRQTVYFATRNLPSIVASIAWQNFICECPREANEILVKCFGPRV